MKNKEKEKYFEGLPANAVDFIKLVIKKMRYRRKIRKEVMVELVGHFEDSLKECKTEGGKEKEAQRLIEEFGDAKLLGKLLRRAKKRCRPLWRTAVLRSFQTVGVLILCLILYVVWFLTGKPAVTVDYLAQWNNLVRPVADESMNAAPLYAQAAQQITKVSDEFLALFSKEYRLILEEIKKLEELDPEDERIVYLSWRLPNAQDISTYISIGLDLCDEIENFLSEENRSSLSEQKQKLEKKVISIMIRLISEPYRVATSFERSLTVKWINENQQTLDLLISGTEKPYCWQEYETQGDNKELMTFLFPPLRRYRDLAKSLCLRAQLNAEGEKYEQAFTDSISCFRFGMHIRSGDKTLVEQLVGIAIQALSVERIRTILNEFEIEFEQLTFLQEEFEKSVSNEKFAISMETERLFVYDEIQRCFTKDRFGGGHIYLARLRELGMGIYEVDNTIEFIKIPLHVLFTHPNKRETKEMADRMYDYMTIIFRKTPAKLRAEGIDIEKEMMALAKGNILLEILSPAFGRVAQLSYRNKIDVEATLTIIALIRYKQNIGEYPESLDELVSKDYLKEVPIDPFSGQPIIYKRAVDDFILYGVGENFVDDGGEVARDDDGRIEEFADEGDWIFWPVEK